MMTLCIVMFSYLQTIVSFERTLEYTELPPEVGTRFSFLLSGDSIAKSN